jgi:4-hydroxythreonine-4-phosphate dehydrogenase
MTAPIAITPGEPAGIGPDLTLQVCAEQAWPAVVIASPELMHERGRALGLRVDIVDYDANAAFEPKAGKLRLASVPLSVPVIAGKLEVANAGYVMRTLKIAVDGCLDGRFRAMVTGPVQKSVIADAGIAFSGHTEFIAERTGASGVVMMLVAGDLRVALATTHLALSDVPRNITADGLDKTLRILQRGLIDRFGIDAPRILVTGLNPHAGEGGHLGREEIEIIGPVLARLRDEGLDVVGPLPADTLFTPRVLEQGDAVLAMYHDQGLPVLKYAGFGHAVNVTLGLPIVRTSVDHGTALDLAQSGSAEAGSLVAAFDLADRLSA